MKIKQIKINLKLLNGMEIISEIYVKFELLCKNEKFTFYLSAIINITNFVMPYINHLYTDIFKQCR